MRYLNRQDKEAVLILGGLVAQIEDRINAWQRVGRMTKNAKLSRTYATKLIDEMMEPLDDTEKEKIIKHMHKMEIVVLPKSEAVAERKKIEGLDSTICIDRDSWLDIADHVLQQCRGCRLKGELVEGCRVRQICVTYDIEFADAEASCPYQWEG